jgi:hypothetical protein
MSLEKQAKTTAQIKGIVPLLGMNEQMWVLLEYHQAEVERWRQQQKDDYETYCEAVADRDSQIIVLKAKIAEANKILKSFSIPFSVSEYAYAELNSLFIGLEKALK